jgi:hypothetical protein
MIDPPGEQEEITKLDQHKAEPAGSFSSHDSTTKRAGDVGDTERAGARSEPQREAFDGFRNAGKGIRKSVIWLVGIIVTALVTGIVGQITGGWFTSSPKAPSKLGATQVRLMQPFGANGRLLAPYQESATLHGGSCSNSFESSDPDALRCFSGNQVADPCWSSVSEVACLVTPWDTKAVVINNLNVNVTPRASIGPVPWALEITDPANPSQILDCGFAGGTAAQIVAGMRANWLCFRPGQFDPHGFVGYALGAPQTGTNPWTVFFGRPNSSQAVEANVLIAWR